MTDAERLSRIARIIEQVDVRCMASDGPVPPTLSEMTQAEISEIYELANDGPAFREGEARLAKVHDGKGSG